MITAVLLDLGNVVLGIDFKRVFNAWAEFSNTPVERFMERWTTDAAYQAHERGEISFEEYARHLGQVFEVEMTNQQWEAGWNSIWTTPFHNVIDMLPNVAERYPLYGFTNTNEVHKIYWQSVYADAFRSFRHMFVSSDLGIRKPDIPAFQQVCDAMNTPPGEVLFLDDTQENVDGAKLAGLNAVLVESEDAVVQQLQQLLLTE